MALRCFVAMSFGHEDTDKVYDDLIVPTLRDKGVTPVRVDRVEHNDDIDDRIISELQKCDFALADLTYARPSVYFEAGFAQRKVPVIYICREDHFLPKADDTFGNFRVHFDLQMKNIIPWSSPSDRMFARRLADRVTHVTGPLIRARQIEKEEKQEAKEFAALSVQEKTERILSICTSRLKRAGYRRIDTIDLLQWTHRRNLSSRILPFVTGWLGIKFVSGTLCAAFVRVEPTITKNLFNEFTAAGFWNPPFNINPWLRAKTLKQLVEHFFLCSLQQVPISRVMTSLPSFRLNQERNEFVWTGNEKVPRGKIPGYDEVYVSGEEEFFVRNAKSSTPAILWVEGPQLFRHGGILAGQVKQIPRRVHVHILDTIKSETDFKAVFSGKVKEVESESS